MRRHEVGFVGDDEEVVVGAAAGGADIEPSVGGGEVENRGLADVDGVALVAVGGGGVAEPDMVLA